MLSQPHPMHHSKAHRSWLLIAFLPSRCCQHSPPPVPLSLQLLCSKTSILSLSQAAFACRPLWPPSLLLPPCESLVKPPDRLPENKPAASVFCSLLQRPEILLLENLEWFGRHFHKLKGVRHYCLQLVACGRLGPSEVAWGRLSRLAKSREGPSLPLKFTTMGCRARSTLTRSADQR